MQEIGLEPREEGHRVHPQIHRLAEANRRGEKFSRKSCPLSLR
jgi:hypothetical protein